MNERTPSGAPVKDGTAVLNYVDLRREGVPRPMGSIIHGEGGGLRREAPDDTARDGPRRRKSVGTRKVPEHEELMNPSF